MTSSLTAVPKLKWPDSGVELPLESDILGGVLDDIDAAFGGGLNRNLETPQGQLASSLAAIIAAKNTEIANIINMVDPQYSRGSWQDAIARIYFLTRKPAQPSVVRVKCTGLAGTVIPAGTLAKDSSGKVWHSVGAAKIDTNGSCYVDFACNEPGAIPCPPHNLNRIYQSIPGLDAIDNEDAAVLGALAESRADFERRRYNSVAKNGHGTTHSIYGEVFQVPGVVDCYVMDNPLGTSRSVAPTDYVLKPHSVYVAVVGGDDKDVATAIWRKKDVGCDYNGNTTVTIYDEDTGYSSPPEYQVTFMRPSPRPVKFYVRLINSQSLPADAPEVVRQRIVETFSGAGENGARERIGARIMATRYYIALSDTRVADFLVSVKVGFTAPSGDSIQIGIDQVPTLAPSDITVDIA